MALRATAVRARDFVEIPAPPRFRPADPNILFLRQAKDLLRAIDDRAYRSATGLLPGGTAGKHLRHALDFYFALLLGAPTGRVDYSRRRRDPGIETSRTLALAALDSIERRLSLLGSNDLGRRLDVRSEESEDAETGDSWSRSTLARELQAVLSHTIHHYALIAVILRSHGISPPPSFGVSPSTLRHRGRAFLREA